jgi:hypothetical protein
MKVNNKILFHSSDMFPAYFTSCTMRYKLMTPITVATRSKTGTVFARSNTGIAGSNPTQGMDICVRLFCDYVVLCVGSGHTTG